jgi:hypothetical protein
LCYPLGWEVELVVASLAKFPKLSTKILNVFLKHNNGPINGPKWKFFHRILHMSSKLMWLPSEMFQKLCKTCPKDTVLWCMEETWPWALQVATFSDLATSWNYVLHKGKLAILVQAGWLYHNYFRCI